MHGDSCSIFAIAVAAAIIYARKATKRESQTRTNPKENLMIPLASEGVPAQLFRPNRRQTVTCEIKNDRNAR